MDLHIAFAVVLLVLVGSYSLSSIGKYLSKRRKYSYLEYEDADYRIPRMALFHFWVFVGSYILNFWIIWSWGTK